MVTADEEHVIRRLEELLGWARYVLESLTEDQAYERGKRDLLEQLVPRSDLEETREAARGVEAALERLIAGTQARAAS